MAALPASTNPQLNVNLVELIAGGGEEDCAWDQPCRFGHRVEEHAVYCHNTAWPMAPRKCRRSVRRPDFRHEDCPGFAPNPLACSVAHDERREVNP
jgi:hypothetical protein